LVKQTQKHKQKSQNKQNKHTNTQTHKHTNTAYCTNLIQASASCNIERNKFIDPEIMEKSKIGTDHLIHYLEMKLLGKNETKQTNKQTNQTNIQTKRTKHKQNINKIQFIF